MIIHHDIEELIRQIEIHAKKKLNYFVEVGELLQIVKQTGMLNEFDELIFQAKFIARTQDVMRRIGPGGDGFGKLSAEFQSSVNNTKEILSKFISKAPDDLVQKFNSEFLTVEVESFSRLINLLRDLGLIKNYQVDGNSLPFEFNREACQKTIVSRDKKKVSGEVLITKWIMKSVILCIILFVLFVLIDPPVTILGWILSFAITGLLMYIIIQIYSFARSSKL